MTLKLRLFFWLLTSWAMTADGQIIEFQTEQIYSFSASDGDKIHRNSLGETSVYTTRLKNNYLKSGCMQEEDCLKYVLFQQVRSGKINAFDAKSDKLLNLDQVKKYLTIQSPNFCYVGGPDSLKFHYYDLETIVDKVLIRQNWKVDLKNGRISNRVERITIGMEDYVDAIEILVPYMYIKFDNEYDDNGISIDDPSISIISIASDKLPIDDFSTTIQSTFLSVAFKRYNCNSTSHTSYNTDCIPIKDVSYDNEAPSIVGYSVKQLFYFNHKNNTINSHLLALSPLVARIKNEEFLYYYPLFSLCNFY